MDDKETKQNSFQNQIQNCKMMLSSIHPGHYFLLGSMPLLYSSYKSYYAPLDPITNEIVKRHLHPTTSEQILTQNIVASAIKNTTTNGTTTTASATATAVLESAEEPIRRAVGLALAGRALRIATMACTGVFCFSISLVFYGCGWTSIPDAVNGTTNWAQRTRQQIESSFGIASQNDDNDPEIIKLNQMTEDEQYDYITKNYFTYNEDDDNDTENNDDAKTKK
jgi:hypothetical protein